MSLPVVTAERVLVPEVVIALAAAANLALFASRMRFWYYLSSRPFFRTFASSFEIGISISFLPLGVFFVVVDVDAMVIC